ncbi:MAG: phage holin family protein [Clostridium chrysemydis]|uniref:phage holin family protein n=1 Tax=Clostridium chrysemydis TaxID=2665504 RepID=UPI003F40C3D0
MDNPYVYFSLSIIVYLLGGIDETLIVLFCLNIIDLILGLLSSNRDKKKLLSHKIKMYLVIILGVMLDKVLGTENNQITKARTYIILAYSYNEVVNIVNSLCSDEDFFVPAGLRKYVKKLKDKSGDKN